MTMRSSFLGPKAASMMEHDRFIIDVANIAAELRAVRLVEVVPISFRGNESSQEELVVVQVELQHRLPETVQQRGLSVATGNKGNRIHTYSITYHHHHHHEMDSQSSTSSSNSTQHYN